MQETERLSSVSAAAGLFSGEGFLMIEAAAAVMIAALIAMAAASAVQVSFGARRAEQRAGEQTDALYEMALLEMEGCDVECRSTPSAETEDPFS